MTDNTDTPQRVTIEYLQEQRAAGWPDVHPEDYCHKCGNRNVSWWVDSEAWNAVMNTATSPYHGILCPSCFGQRFEERYPETAWELRLSEDTRGARTFREHHPLPTPDNTDREKLIEEAERAMYDVYSSRPPFGGLDIEGMASAALDVFEKAHTPTDDEREALILAVQSVTWNASNYPRGAQPHILGQDVVPLTMKIVESVSAAGFRRTAVAESSTEMIAPEDGMTLEELGEAISNWSPAWDGDEAMHSLIYRFIEHYAELDGELYAARESTDFDEDAEILFRYEHEKGTLVLHTPEPQGEPSDAQVLAALKRASMLAWNRRKDDLAKVLTAKEWSLLRLDLRSECANHEKADELYGFARDCEHDVPTDDPDFEDDQHAWSHDAEELICLARVVAHACLCQDGYCSQIASAEEARDDLWANVSFDHRRAMRAAHLASEVAHAFFGTHGITYGRLQDIAAACKTEAELRHRADRIARGEQ